MDKFIEVTIDVSEDSMCGSEGWGKYDPDKSISAFLEMVKNKLGKAYPKFNIEVTGYDNAREEIFTSEVNIDEDIKAIIEEVWSSFRWVRRA